MAITVCGRCIDEGDIVEDKLIVDAVQVNSTECRVAVYEKDEYGTSQLEFLDYTFENPVDTDYVNSLIQAFPLKYVSLMDKRITRLNIDSIEFNQMMVVVRGRVHLSQATTKAFWRALFDWGISPQKLEAWKVLVESKGSTIKPVTLKLFIGKDCTALHIREVIEALQMIAVQYDIQWGIGCCGIAVLFVELISYAKRTIKASAYFTHTSKGMLIDKQRSSLSLVPNDSLLNDALILLYTRFLCKLTESVRLRT